jgi:hypothetical protein
VEVVRVLVEAGAAVNQAKVRDDCGGCWVVLCTVFLRMGRFVSQRARVDSLEICCTSITVGLGVSSLLIVVPNLLRRTW